MPVPGRIEMKLSEKHAGLRIGLEMRKPQNATDSEYRDYEKIIIELYDGVVQLEERTDRQGICTKCGYMYSPSQLEAENEELRELFVYFFGENYEELAEG